MEILDLILGRDKKGDGFLAGIIRSLGRWVIGCGCLLFAGLIAALVFLVATTGSQALSVIVVVATIVVAIASLIRTSLGY